MRMLQLQQNALGSQTAGISGQAAIFPDYAVAGDKDRKGIAVVCHPDRPHGAWPADFGCKIAVSTGFAVWDLQQGSPDLLLEGCALRGERNLKLLPDPGKIF